MRRRSTDLDEYARALLEAQYYRPAMYEFMAATAADPDLLVEADLDERSTVLDVGAYVGEWSEEIADRYGSTIFAFEPNPRAFRRLEARFRERPNVMCFEYGLAGADARAALALDGPGSTIDDRPGSFGSTEVQLRDVAAVIEELGLPQIDLCKMNIEGGEYDVFDRLIGTGLIARMRIVSVQFHEWHPHAYRRRRAIRRRLRRTHEEVWNHPFIWELWRRRG
jgi:FkbM family methyltransferase